MFKPWSLLAWVLAASVFSPVNAQDAVEGNMNTDQLIAGGNAFAWELYGEVAGQNDQNLFFSPYSVMSAFAMAYEGAREKTAEQFMSVFHWPSDRSKLHEQFSLLSTDLRSTGENAFRLEMANRPWVQQGFALEPAFVDAMARYYDGQIEELDFQHSANAARLEINKWVAERTEQKIKDLIPEGALDDSTRLVLTNAVYFKAAWLKPFEVDATQNETFMTEAGSRVETPFMHGKVTTNFCQTDQLKILELPYEEGRFSMILLLPNDPQDIAKLESQLAPKALAEWMDGMQRHAVQLALPKFEARTSLALNGLLQALGLRDAFDAEQADFDGITKTQRLHIDTAVHQAFVKVDEAGTEAAASTAIAFGVTSIPNPAEFRADHPFVYFIRDNRNGCILFVGRVTDPSS